MISIGISEIILIIIGIILFIHPNDIPKLIRKSAEWQKILRQYWTQIKREFNLLDIESNTTKNTEKITHTKSFIAKKSSKK